MASPLRSLSAALLVALWLPGCLSSSARAYDGPERPAAEVVRLRTGEGFWGDKTLHLTRVNDTPLWQPSSLVGRMFEVFMLKNDVRVLPGEIEATAGGGQRVRFEGQAGATYRLSLVESFHDSIPVLVVARESDGGFVADSEPRLDTLRSAPWELDEGWHVMDWRRYRSPHARVETDVVLYERPAPAQVGDDWSGATWITSVGYVAAAQPAETFALAADLRLDLELDYSRLSLELLQRSPRILRFSGRARAGGNEVSGFIAAGRAGDVLRGMSCVGPGAWALSAHRFQERLRRAVERAR